MSEMPIMLDAPKELQDWFAEARLRLSNKIRVELRLPDDTTPHLNQAMLGLDAGGIMCSLTVFGGGYINITQKVYGNVEYIVHDMQNDKALRCKDTLVQNLPSLRSTLDESLDDFNKLVACFSL